MDTLEPHILERAVWARTGFGLFPGSIEVVDISYSDAEGRILAWLPVHKRIDSDHQDGASPLGPDSSCAISADQN
jgi:hypothetical protein